MCQWDSIINNLKSFFCFIALNIINDLITKWNLSMAGSSTSPRLAISHRNTAWMQLVSKVRKLTATGKSPLQVAGHQPHWISQHNKTVIIPTNTVALLYRHKHKVMDIAASLNRNTTIYQKKKNEFGRSAKGETEIERLQRKIQSSQTLVERQKAQTLNPKDLGYD